MSYYLVKLVRGVLVFGYIIDVWLNLLDDTSVDLSWKIILHVKNGHLQQPP